MEEQLDIEEGKRMAAAKAFAHRHRFLLATLVAALIIGAAAGWGYQRYRQAQQLEASQQYQEGLKALSEGRRGDARQAFKGLVSEHPGTSYAGMGRVLRARLLHEGGDAQAALEVLAPLVDGGGPAEARHLAVEETARIQWAAGDIDAALATLEGIAGQAYMPSYFQLRGDLLAAAGRTEAARAAYQRALQQPGSAPLGSGLEARLDQLPAADGTAGKGGGE